MRGRLTEHLARLLADGKHAAGVYVFGDDGGLAQHDALTLDEDQHVGRAKVDPDIQANPILL